MCETYVTLSPYRYRHAFHLLSLPAKAHLCRNRRLLIFKLGFQGQVWRAGAAIGMLHQTHILVVHIAGEQKLLDDWVVSFNFFSCFPHLVVEGRENRAYTRGLASRFQTIVFRNTRE